MLYIWIGTMVLLWVVIAAIGKALTGQFLAALMDGRNKMSLSRFQMTMWTVIILSGLAVGIGWNLIHVALKDDPFNVTVPDMLWTLMGISLASGAGSSLVLATKAGQDANQAQLPNAGTNGMSAQGQLLVRLDAKAARWSDMFRGDEVGNGSTLDLSKIQMFFFTVVLGVGYAVLLGRQFYHLGIPNVQGVYEGMKSFPLISSGMVALLGISHGGYLAYKAAPHSAGATVTIPAGPAHAASTAVSLGTDVADPMPGPGEPPFETAD